MNSTTIRKEINEINKFYIVEYAIGETSYRHKFSNIYDSIDVDINKPVFRSYFLHSSEIIEYYNSHKDDKGNNTLSGYVGCVSSNELKIDIDEKEKSLEQVRKLLQKWETLYDLDLRYIKINFSGSKGFHIRIPAILFGGFEASENLPALHKYIALQLCDGFKIDESVYKTTGLFRAVNSINNKSGLYAVPLTIDELFTNSFEEIKLLAQDQREVEYIDEEELIPIPALVAVKESAQPNSPTINFKSLKNYDSIFEPAKEGARNESLVKLVGTLIARKYKNQDILSIALLWNKTCTPPEEETSVIKSVESMINAHGQLEGRFWKMNKGTISIMMNPYMNFLESEGFSKNYLGLSYVYIWEKDKIVKQFQPVQIKDHVLEYARKSREIPDNVRPDLLEVLFNRVGKYFGEGLLECIATKEMVLHKDTKVTANLYYQNGYVQLAKGEAPVLRGYHELDLPIWESSIISRELVLESGSTPSEYETFLRRVMKGQTDRYDSLRSAIGYLLHDYKDMSQSKAIILCDEKISDNPNGRSGKSLIAKAINKIKKVDSVDGKNFNFNPRFTFQDIGVDTKVIDFNDVRKEFDFEKLFSVITDSMSIEYKNQPPVRIKFEDSPKIILSTNYTIKGGGGSFADRMFEIEFSDHYNENHKPADEFGHLFFEDWDGEEWNRFDNFMISCLQLYLEKGLVGCAPINIAVRKLRDQTDPSFVEFADDSLGLSKEYDLKNVYESFKSHIGYGFDVLHPCPVKQNTFSSWLNTYSDFKGWKLNKRQSNGRQIVNFTVKT